MLNGIELAFVICAAIGGVLFLSRFVMQLLGFHHDVSFDINTADLDLTHSDIGFKLLSFQTITAFLTMFGLVGFAMTRAQQAGALASVGAATIAGVLAAWVIALLFRGMGRLQSAGDYNPKQAVGQRGTVYLTIPADGAGKVSVTVNNRLSVLDAVAQDKQAIKTGDAIQVVDIVGGNVLVVKKV